ncbi:MAG TPA: hypothetical protein VFM18_00875 [Methanosarcina sp.]|nr:hypothetical protein [Methanosarcina sp.]
MKPRMKFKDGMWMCGGLFVAPWYIDWSHAETPEEAYRAWKEAQNTEYA